MGADGDTVSESSRTATSPPSATSQGDAEAKGKRKRSEATGDSESSGESPPKIVMPLRSAAPASSDPEDPFAMGQEISS
jgi:hypothetical protein